MKSGQAQVELVRIVTVAPTIEIAKAITKEWKSKSTTWTKYQIKNKAKYNKVPKMSTK